MKPSDAMSRQSDYTSDGFSAEASVPKKPPQTVEAKAVTLNTSDETQQKEQGRSHLPLVGRSAEPGRTIPPSTNLSKSLYLRCALKHTLSKVEAAPKLTKKEWRDYERLRQLAFWLRNQAGFNPWPPLAFALGLLIISGVLLYHAEHKVSGHLRVLHNVYTVARLDDYNFRFQVRDPFSNQDIDFGLTACKTFKPTAEIQQGVTLSLLQFVQHDDNSCVDFTLLSNGYTLLRGKNNEPIKSDAGPSTGASVQRPTTETTSTAPGTGQERTLRQVGSELQHPRKGN